MKLNLLLLLMIAGAAIAALLLGPQAAASTGPVHLPVVRSAVFVLGR